MREGDIEALLADMRLDDLREAVASSDEPVDAAVCASVHASAVCYAVEIGGRLACLFGVAVIHLAPATGAPWLLGTRWLDQNPRELVRASRQFLDEHLLRRFPQMLNYVDARNVRSIRWLRALGFTIRPAQPYGPMGLPFHRFDRGFDHVPDRSTDGGR